MLKTIRNIYDKDYSRIKQNAFFTAPIILYFGMCTTLSTCISLHMCTSAYTLSLTAYFCLFNKAKYGISSSISSQAFQLHKSIYVDASYIKFTISEMRFVAFAFMQLIKHIGTLRMKLFSTYILHNTTMLLRCKRRFNERSKKKTTNCEIKRLRQYATVSLSRTRLLHRCRRSVHSTNEMKR